MSEAAQQIAQKFNLQFVARSEIAMPAFAGEDVLAIPIPIMPGFAEAGSSGHYRLISGSSILLLIERNLIQSDRV